MGRSTFLLNYSDFQKAENTINQILYANGFKQTIVNSEHIWKKGGVFIGGQCVKIEFSENKIHISAWITPMLGSDEEYNLNGYGAIVPKQQLLSTIEQLKYSIQ